jgi:DNA-binding NarL/FixJ family response regulator
MFQKVLISDDLSSINKGVLAVLEALGIQEIKQVQYCDDAYLQIKSAIANDTPFDLFITDLSFKTDHREATYPSGESLIMQLFKESIEIKTIVYSIEDKFQRVRTLVNKNGTDAYVCKGRNGLLELSAAIESVMQGNLYLSPQVQNAITRRSPLQITDYDIELMRQLSLGKSKEQVSFWFKNNNITPSSLSSVEKRQNKLLIAFKAHNAVHLIGIVKDLGLI